MTDTRHPGLITPDNAPRLADLDDDTTPYPAQLTITCDGCPTLSTEDYLVPADSTSSERFEIAREHLRGTLGWSCTDNGDYCPGCSMVPVLAEVQAERMRQIAKWGVQRRADGTPSGSATFNVEAAKRHCQRMEAAGGAHWAAVLSEEFFEAMAESDLANLRAELVQVAAVCVAWVEDIDSRTAGA